MSTNVVVLVVLSNMVRQMDDAFDCLLHFGQIEYLSQVCIVLFVQLVGLLDLLTGVVLQARPVGSMRTPERLVARIIFQVGQIVGEFGFERLLIGVDRVHLVQGRVVAKLVRNHRVGVLVV